MPAGIAAALMLLADAAASRPTAPNPPKQAAGQAEEACVPNPPTADTKTIVVCGQKPQGYRLNPDVMAARRLKKQSDAGRPTRPGPAAFHDKTCGTVGPAPCMTGGINLVGVALTAAEMASRVAKGQEVGSMFVTDPHPSEYQLYLEAKREREAKEAEKKAAAAAAAAKAAEPPRP